MTEPTPSSHDLIFTDGNVRLMPRPAPIASSARDTAEYRETLLDLAVAFNSSQELVDGLRKLSGEDLRTIGERLIHRLQTEL